MTIWHYTCDHRADGIRADRLVNPNPQPALGGTALSWWTDLGTEHRYETGLTSITLTCDRMAHRYAVADPAHLVHWPVAARALRVPRHIRDELEDGRLPAHWWVALVPVAVTL